MRTIEDKPKVSVCIVTYNHEKYIRECLQSIVNQETDFRFEAIVSDDCSTDATREIVQEYAEIYPKIIRPILHKKNMGAFENFITTHNLANGTYICHMDGDDYALPGKLSAQVRVLDDNPAVSLSAHAVVIHGTGKIIGNEISLPVLANLNDLLTLGTYFVNSSTMYRKANRFVNQTGSDCIDFQMYIEQASTGYIHLIKIPLGGYRIHSESVTKNKLYRNRIENAYDYAFKRAGELGADPSAVSRGQLRVNKNFAIAAILNNSPEEFTRKIQITSEAYQYADIRHKCLFYAGIFLPQKILRFIVEKYINR